MMRPLNHITVEGMNCPVSRIVSFGAAGSSSHHNVGATALGTPGICGMKTIARAYTWWPKLDQEIEKAVRVCTIYQNIRNSPFSAPLTTEKKTVNRPHLIFATHGLPEEVVSNNGPHFTSTSFAEFTCKHGIKHILVPPYHPESSEAAKRSVRVVKDALIKQVLEGTKGISMK